MLIVPSTPTPPKPANQTWIAGAVAAPVCLFILTIAVFLLIRRSKRSKINIRDPSMYEKPELHADNIQPKELEAMEPTELPAKEVKQELSADLEGSFSSGVT